MENVKILCSNIKKLIFTMRINTKEGRKNYLESFQYAFTKKDLKIYC